MSRRFLGCALRVAGKDEWFPKDERLWRGKEHRALLKPRQAYALASKMQEPESVRVVWVFATRKPRPSLGDLFKASLDARKPKPAPAEGAADARYACWQGCCMWLTPEDDDPRDTGTRAEAEAVVARIPGAKLVRILDDGAHEAGVEAARREERERTESEVLTFLADAYKANVFKGANETTKEVNRALQAVSEWIRARPTREKTAHDMAAHEAAKGQAK